MSLKFKRIFLLFVYVLLACTVVYILKPVYLVSVLLVLVPPALVNFWWLKKSRVKVFLFCLIALALFAPPVELAARLTDAWDVQSVLPRLFGIAPLENLLFAFLNFFWVLSFYEYFVDKDTGAKISRRLKILTGLFVVLSTVTYSLFFYQPNFIALNYHALAVVTLLIPGLIIFVHRPRLLRKTLIPILFFAVVFFVYEYVALAVGNWWWPGDYLFPITLAGKVFPLDDVIIWYFLSTPVLIGGYEFFADDDK